MTNKYTNKPPGKAMYTSVNGLTGTVSGKIGDKRLTILTNNNATNARSNRP